MEQVKFMSEEKKNQVREMIKNSESQEFITHYDQNFVTLQELVYKKQADRKNQYRYLWVAKKLKGLEGGTILDIGCGDGTLALTLHGEGFTIKGIDISEKALQSARENVPAEFIKGNIEEMPFPDGSFDAVVGVEVLEHVKDLDKAVSEAFRVCKPGGKLLFTVPYEKNHDVPEHLRHFDFYNLCDLFEGKAKNFIIMRIEKFTKGGDKTLFAVEVFK